MTGLPPGDPVLSADISATGKFIVIGTIHGPGPALAAAIRDLQDGPTDPELLEIAVYSLASSAFGVCALDSSETAHVLRAWLEAQLAAGWRIEIPGTGRLQALFSVTRFDPVRDDGRTFALGLRLAGKPEFIAGGTPET